MDGVVDSCVFIAAERRQWSVERLLQKLKQEYPDRNLVIPSVVLAELIEGVHRAATNEQSMRRAVFVGAIEIALPIIAIDAAVAHIAGRIRGSQAKSGNTLPPIDALVAACAIHLRSAVITNNIKDFSLIPHLTVLSLNVS